MSAAPSWGDIVTVLSVLIAFFGTVGGAWWRIHQSISKVARRGEEIRAKSAHELAEFKLEVAREYATDETIKVVEERLIDTIKQIGDRFDRLSDRLDGLFEKHLSVPRRRRPPSSE